MKIPLVESRFPKPWDTAARRVLPNSSPLHAAAALWGPVLGWCALELLARSVDPGKPQRVAIDLFDRLRLREPFAQAFNAHGEEGEEGWRAAARIKVLLLTEAGVGERSVQGEETRTAAAARKIEEEVKTAEELPVDEGAPFARSLWLDPDVRWLTGMHEAEGHSYVVREPYEELLWWLKLPSLLHLAAEPAPSRVAADTIKKAVDDALAQIAIAGYRVDALPGIGSAFSNAAREIVGAGTKSE
jgi:hypothetical protein